MFVFAEETGVLDRAPRLKTAKNESTKNLGPREKPLYTPEQISSLLDPEQA